LDRDFSEQPHDVASDMIDAASDASNSELQSQLSAFESRELEQIDRALKLLRMGKYGHCERCDSSIPIERLKALPYTTLCVKCQSSAERHPAASRVHDNWASVYDHEGRMSEPDVALRDLPVDND
jgi:DnaK suppressor protein